MLTLLAMPRRSIAAQKRSSLRVRFALTIISLLVGVSAVCAEPNSGDSANVAPDGAGRTNVVVINTGAVRGIVKDGMRMFLGMPYATPPVGNLRWRPPHPHASWTGVRDAVAYGKVCAQNNTTFPGFGFISYTEDCLFVNVVTPVRDNGGRKRPVMVWIPGGGLFIGGSTGYDPSALVKDGDVVYVSLNYRLNVFGFFSHPAINSEGHAAGNYGIMDQQLALQWVKQNIAAFGGDPNNVTIFGESAGGISVWANIASPASAGLFHKAIIESGTGTANAFTPTLKDEEPVGRALGKAT